MPPSPTAHKDSLLDSGIEVLRGLTLGDSQENPNEILDTTAAISSLVDELSGLSSTPPSLYIDLEGDHLSRHGTISILQIHVRTTGQNYLVDVMTLGKAAFLTPGTRTPDTLKAILESPYILKVFFDVRNDSDALYSHYGINLAGIQDLQLMEYATRTGRKTFLSGLKKCIEMDMPMAATERRNWVKAKDEGRQLFLPEKGGSYEVFNQRPLAENIRIYCIQDVHCLPRLWDLYNRKLTPRWRAKVQAATKDRVVQSQAKNFNGRGEHMRLPPEGWGRR